MQIHMLLIFAVLITATAAGSLLRVWVPGSGSSAHLGWMSEQWLAEYRAAHPS